MIQIESNAMLVVLDVIVFTAYKEIRLNHPPKNHGIIIS